MPDDSKRLLRSARRSSINTREQMSPGMPDFMLLVLAAMTAALLTGAYYHSSSSRLLSAAIMAVGAYTITKSLRARAGLGVALSRWTIIVPGVVFIASLVGDLALDGNARDVSVFLILGGGAVVEMAMLRNGWFALVAACLGAIALVGAFLVPHSSSTVSLALGVVFGLVVALAARWRAAGASSLDHLKRRK